MPDQTSASSRARSIRRRVLLSVWLSVAIALFVVAPLVWAFFFAGEPQPCEGTLLTDRRCFR